MRWDVFELGYRYVLPSIRRMLVLSLRERKLSQEEIARLVGLSQSAVSKYLNTKRGSNVDLQKHDDLRKEIEALADRVIGGISEEDLSVSITILAFKSMAKGYVCEFHSEIDRTLNPKECNLCKKLFDKLVMG